MQKDYTYEDYLLLIHAMQSGVAMKLQQGDGDGTSPKHLRVGVNSAMIESSAIVELLIDKGVFDRQEFLNKLCEVTEREVRQYEQELSEMLGADVSLG